MFFWLLFFISAVVFFVTFWRMPMFPKAWSLYLLAGLAGIAVIMFLISGFVARKNKAVKIVNILLTVCMVAGTILLPYYTDRISRIFNSVIGDKVNINLYVMRDAYKDAHADLFGDYIHTEESVNIDDFRDVTYIRTSASDTENQDYALGQLNQLFGQDVNTSDYNTVSEAAQALYNNYGTVLIMSEAYESVLSDMEGFETFRDDTKVIYTFTRTIKSSYSDKNDVKMTSEPFTIFFGGNDQEGELSLMGRTDVDMSVTVNPKTHQIVIVSLPRDSYIPNPALYDSPDKLTHLGLSGIDNTLKGISAYLDTDIENYMLINFTTYKKIIDALGGVDVENPYAFTYTWDKEYHFEEGTIHLDGQAALYYVRERYSLPDGDFGRNMHQQIVMQGIIKKLTSSAALTKFNSLLSALDGTFLTNVSSDSFYALARMQLGDNAEWNTVSYHLTGAVGSAECASMPGMQLSVVFPNEAQAAFVSQVIDDVISGEIITQQELPD